MRFTGAGVLAAVVLLAAGCTHAPLNARLRHFDPGRGYRYSNACRIQNSDRVALILTFSGGGTRAAALAYGVLKGLRDTPMPDGAGRMLDEVDLISSVSGGSFTAAYYGLFGERLFDEFEERVLRFPLQSALGWRVLWPPNTWRVMSQTYGRSDMAARYYDKWLFHALTFGDLRACEGPFIVINATDMTFGAPFPFTQDQFDLLYSDLDSYPVSRAVAASSAFPVALAPLTLRNYERGDDFVEPSWVAEAVGRRDRNWRLFWRARQARSFADHEKRPYVHILDGGVADNLGLRSILQALDSPGANWSLRRLIRERRIDRVAFIVVNAQLNPVREWDQWLAGPNEVEVADATIKGLIDNYTYETAAELQDTIRTFQLESEVSAATPRSPVRFYAIDVSFDRVADPELRETLSNMPTALELPDEDIDLLIDAGGAILRESPEFQRLLHDLTTP